MTDKKSKTAKTQAKQPSKGYRKFLRRQKQAARQNHRHPRLTGYEAEPALADGTRRIEHN